MPSAYYLRRGVTCADCGVGEPLYLFLLWKRERPSPAREGDAIGKPSSGPRACFVVTHSQEH